MQSAMCMKSAAIFTVIFKSNWLCDWQCYIFIRHQASFHKQTSSTCSASVNKDRLFVRLCEGVWLATIMALAPACMITLTWGCFVGAVLVISAGLNLDKHQNNV